MNEYYVSVFVESFIPKYSSKHYYFLVKSESEERCRLTIDRIIKNWKLAYYEDEVLVVVGEAKYHEKEIEYFREKGELQIIGK